MDRHLSFFIVLMLAMQVNAVEEDHRDITHDRGSLTQVRSASGKGYAALLPRSVEEGREILLDGDSYPRPPARLASASMEPCAQGYRIAFTLSGTDDVLVQAVDDSGSVLCQIAHGLVGDRAEPPFASDRLDQVLIWDGLDAQGRPLPPEALRVRIAVGAEAVFTGFVGHDPAQLMPYVNAIHVAPDGSILVELLGENRYRTTFLRFDRLGAFHGQVAPAAPRRLPEETDLAVTSVYGTRMPVKHGIWRADISRWDGVMPLPLWMSDDGAVQMLLGQGRLGANVQMVPLGDYLGFNPMPETSMYGFLDYTAFLRHQAATTVTSDGRVFIATRSAGKTMHSDPVPTQVTGLIRAFQLPTGDPISPFSKHPDGSDNDRPHALGTAHTLPILSRGNPDKRQALYEAIFDVDRAEPDPEYDAADRFMDIVAVAVDERADRILVADGFPRRIKCYSGNGVWLGDVDGLVINGDERRFRDLIALAWSPDATWILSSFQGTDTEDAYLVKCRGQAPELEVIWQQPLDYRARALAVDGDVIWVGNGGGLATISRINDGGDSVAELRQIGGMPDGRIICPTTLTANADGDLYTFDAGRSRLIRSRADGSGWAASEPLVNTAFEHSARWRRIGLTHDGDRLFDPTPASMIVDPRNGDLLVTVRGNQQKPSSQRWRADLQQRTAEQPQLDDVVGPGAAIAMAADGTLYMNGHRRQWEKRDGFTHRAYGKSTGYTDYGAIHRYHPDGSVDNDWIPLFTSGGSIAVDSQGCIYTMDTVRAPYHDTCYYFPGKFGIYGKRGDAFTSAHFLRGERPVTRASEITYLVKFGPEGGERCGPGERWAHRGVSLVSGTYCNCQWPSNLLAIDPYDRIVAADVVHNDIKILDRAGHLITRFGTWQGAAPDIQAGSPASALGFSNIRSLAASANHIFVADLDLRRIASVQLRYREERFLTVR